MATRGGGLTWDDTGLINSLKTLNARADRSITAATQYHARQGEGWMREHAPWTDRTSNARNGLFGVASREFPSYKITFSHSVPYGLWLEVLYAGRYAIIRPTVQHEGTEVMKTVSRLFQVLFGGARGGA